jgi:hypothetical protein
VPRRRDHLDRHLTQGYGIAIAQQPVEVAAVRLHVVCREARREHALHLEDARADRERRRGALLQILRR